MTHDAPRKLILANARSLRQFQELPETGDWLVCPNGHLVAQYQKKQRIGHHEWHKYPNGAVTQTRQGGKRILCGICNSIALSSNYGCEPFRCVVVSNSVVQRAIASIGSTTETVSRLHKSPVSHVSAPV